MKPFFFQIKNHLFLIALLFIFSCSNEKKEIKETESEIKCQIGGLPNVEFLLQKITEKGIETIDTAKADQDGKFSFQFKLDLPEMMLIRSDDIQPIEVFCQNGSIEMHTHIDSMETVKVKGSAVHDEYLAYLKKLKSFNDKIDQLYQEYEEAAMSSDEEEMKQAENKFLQAQEELKQYNIKQIKESPKSIVSAFMAWKDLIYILTFEELEAVVKSFDKSIDKSFYVIQLNNRVNILRNVAIGKPAPEIKQNTPEGKELSSLSFKGKYLLIDFWASWCQPCRKENPNIVKAFQKFNKKGFEILGVSLDEKKEDWTAAIKSDKLTWSHVSELKGWENSAAKLYGVMGIPHSVLVNKEGIIVAKDLREMELMKKLTELIK